MVNNSTNFNNMEKKLHNSYYLNFLTMTYVNENLGSGLGQAQKCGCVKLVDSIPILSHISNNTHERQYKKINIIYIFFVLLSGI